MTILLTADIHQTTNPRDAYRWDLFAWLRKQVTKTGAKAVCILGDGTDAKDRHPAKLVNRMASELKELAEKTHVIWLRGNHDYLDVDTPFFEFVKLLDFRIDFITKPTFMDLDDGINGARNNKQCLFLPNARNYREEWKDVDFEAKATKYIFCHQTFVGSLAENGTRLQDGVPPSFFANFRGQVWSGDVHVPQTVGNIEYVGAPYRMHFGDEFTPRCVLLRQGKSSDLHFPTVDKHLVVLRRVDSLNGYDFPEGDQVKVRVELKRRDYGTWKQTKADIRKLAQDKGWQLFGPELVTLPDDNFTPDEDTAYVAAHGTPEDILRNHADVKGLSKDLTKLGLELLKGA